MKLDMTELRDRILRMIYSDRRPEQAILQLNLILKKTPENGEALALKAYALNKLANEQKDWSYSERALELASRAIALDAADDIALTSKGWALIDLGRAGEALKPLQQATRSNPNNEYAWYNLAWAQYLTGDAASSKASIERALKIHPGDPIILRGQRMMEEGRIPEHLKARSRSR